MSNEQKPVVDINDESTAEEILAYLQSKPPIYFGGCKFEGMSLSFVNPAMEERDTGLPGQLPERNGAAKTDRPEDVAIRQ